MGVIGHIFASAGLVFLGFGAAVGFMFWVVTHTDAGQLALAVQHLQHEAATRLTKVEAEVAAVKAFGLELREKVAALWGKRDG